MLNLVALVAKTGSKIDLLGHREFFLRRRALGRRDTKNSKTESAHRQTRKKAGIPAVDEIELHLLQFS